MNIKVGRCDKCGKVTLLYETTELTWLCEKCFFGDNHE